MLATVGDLSNVGADVVKPFLQDLIHHILSTLVDVTAITKQEVAVRALGLLIGNTGEVVQPYLQHPELMSTLLSVLNRGGGVPWSLRFEVLRTIGVLGAIDPYQLNQANLAIFRRNAAAAVHHTAASTAVGVTDADNRGVASVSAAGGAGGPAATSAGMY